MKQSNHTSKISAQLAKFLANTYLLYLKTQSFHWNVSGPYFHTLHTMFEDQYKDLAEAVDEIAERLRALGVYAPGSFAEFLTLATLKEANTKGMKAMDMVKALQADHEAIAEQARELFELASEAGDEVTVGLVIDRMGVHEKTAWMLRSTVE